MRTSSDGASNFVEGSLSLGEMRFRQNLCDGMKELRPDYKHLTTEDFASFLKTQGIDAVDIKGLSDADFKVFLQQQGIDIGDPVAIRAARSDFAARDNLVLMKLSKAGENWSILVRVAVSRFPSEAGHGLHEAILFHGTGSWGIHRSNLAVLGPIGSVDRIIAFVGKSKLACWGVLDVAGRDDDFVVPGGYLEL